MRNFFRHLRAAWKFCQFVPYVELPDQFWLMDDARNLSNFLMSDTGVKLRHILRNKTIDSASRAVMETGPHAQHLCGTAFGIRATVAELDSLLDPMRTKEALSMGDEELAEIFQSKQEQL
jgi:hypothetical protein